MSTFSHHGTKKYPRQSSSGSSAAGSVGIMSPISHWHSASPPPRCDLRLNVNSACMPRTLRSWMSAGPLYVFVTRLSGVLARSVAFCNFHYRRGLMIPRHKRCLLRNDLHDDPEPCPHLLSPMLVSLHGSFLRGKEKGLQESVPSGPKAVCECCQEGNRS